MKNIIILAFIIFMNNNLKAQTPNIVTEYDTCSHLSQYQGEWIFANGNDTIRVYLRFHREEYVQNSSHRSVTDYLVGWHERKSGNTIIESNYQHRFINLPYNMEDFSHNYYSITLNFAKRLNDCFRNAKKLHGFIVDYNQQRRLQAVSITINTTKTSMIWKQQHADNYGGTFSTEMTLPAEFVLIKQ